MKYVMDTDGNIYAFSAADAHHNNVMRALRNNGVTVRPLGPGAEVTDPDAAGFIWRNADGSFVHEDGNMVESGPYADFAQRNAPAGGDDPLFFEAPTNPTNDLDQWVMGEFEDGAPSRAFVLDDLVDRERNIVRTTPRSDQFDLNGMLRDNEWGDDFSMLDRLDRSLGEYGVGGARESTPLLSQAIPIGVGAAGGGAVAYALDGEAEAGDGETDENGEPLLPILGAGLGAAGLMALSRGNFSDVARSEVGVGGLGGSRSGRGNLGITDTGARNAAETGTEADFLTSLPTNPEQWRDIVGAHPWINSPSRAQAVIMANAKRADGAFVYSVNDILEQTGIASPSSLNVTLSKARAAGVPISFRTGAGPGGATARPNDSLIRALDVLEQAPTISREDLAQRLGMTRDSLKQLFSQARRGHNSRGLGQLPPELVDRVRRVVGSGRTGGDSASAWIAGIIGGGTGGALLFGDEADAEDTPELSEARGAVTQQQERLRRLEDLSSRAANDPNAARELQAIIGAVPDGRFGPETAREASAYRDQLRAELTDAEARLERFETDAAAAAAEPDPGAEVFQKWAPLAALTAGAGTGHWLRGRAVSEAARELAAANAAINARIPQGNVPLGRGAPSARERQRRAAQLNELWVEGGAGERVPFRSASNAQGFARNPNTNVAPPSELFSASEDWFGPESQLVRPGDVAIGAGGLIEGSLAWSQVPALEQELEQAEAAAAADPTSVAAQRLVEDLRMRIAIVKAAGSFGLGIPLGRATGAASHRYQHPRPDVAALENQRMQLDRYLAETRPPPRPRVRPEDDPSKR